MTMMRDTEGDYLPNDGPDGRCWDIQLCGDGGLILSIPMQFDAGEDGEYNGFGVVSAELGDLLEEYLDDCAEKDGGKGLRPMAEMLYKFAKKYEAAATALEANGAA